MAYEEWKNSGLIEAADQSVEFWLKIDGRPHRFRVSREALVDHFCASSGVLDSALAAFERGRDKIFEAAAQKHNVCSMGKITVESSNIR